MRGDKNKTKIQRPSPTYKLSTDYEKKYELQTKLKTSTLEKKWDRENT